MARQFVNLAEIMGQVDNARANESNLKRQQQIMQMQDYDYQRQLKQDQEQEALKGVYSGAITNDNGMPKLDENKLITDMMSRNPEMALKLQDQFRTRDLQDGKLKNETEAANIDALTKKAAYSRDRLAGVAEDGSNYAPIRQNLIDTGAASADILPEQFDANVIGSLIMKADDVIKQSQPKEYGTTINYDQQNRGFIVGKDGSAKYLDNVQKSPEKIDYNKPFLPSGMPNITFQDYEKNKKQAQISESESSDSVDYGLPRPQVPWDKIADSKARDRFKQKEYEISRKKLDAFSEEVDKNKSLATRADRFLQLNRQNATGGLVDKIPGGQFVQSFGSDYAEMQSIVADIVPEMREKGSGATSDFDAKMFQRATVGVDKPGNANKNIVDAIKARAQITSDKQDYLNAYLEQNGTLVGADANWKKYVDANPIFDKKQEKTLSINKRRKSWNEYFSSPQKNNINNSNSNSLKNIITLPNGKQLGINAQGRAEYVK